MNQEIYVMRLWHEKNHQQAWRVTITDTRSNEKKHFASLENLSAFFREKVQDEALSLE
jgi:hypothetical protein